MDATRESRWRRPPRSLISLLLRVLVAVGALTWILVHQDWGRLIGVFTKLSPTVFGATCLLYATGQVLLALRWWVLLRAQGIALSTGAVVRLHYLGLFYNNVMPSSIGGDLLRAWYAGRHTERRLEAMLSVFFDRIWGLVGLILIAVGAYAIFHEDLIPSSTVLGAETTVDGQALLGAILTGAAVVLGLGFLALAVPTSRRFLLRTGGALRLRIAAGLGRVGQAFWLYCRSPGALLAAMGLTFLLQAVVISAFWMLGRSLGIGAGPAVYFVIFPVTWVVAALPISVAGLGVLEGGVTALLVRLGGAAPEEALALALCQRFVWVLCSLPGGLIHLSGTHLPQAFSFADESADG